MNPDKVTKFGPGQAFRLDKRVIFVEYESMTGELVKCRFDLSQKTEMIYNDHRILSFDDLMYLYSGDEEIFIKKVLYYEQECHMVVGDKLLIPTKVYFENAGYQQAYETHTKLTLPNSNSAYGISSRDWGDVLADSARYIHMQQSRCSGKTLWLSSATSFADKQPFWNLVDNRDICEQWLKQPPTPYEFIADDLEDCEKGVPNTKLIDPNEYFGVKNIIPKPMCFRGKTWTHPESSYGKKGHMLVTDINSKTFIPDDDDIDVEVNDVMWYDDGNNGKTEPDDHGKLFVWQGLGVGWKKLSDDNGYFDIADKFTRSEILSSNELRAIVGFKPVDDPQADQLRNSNLNQSPDVASSLQEKFMKAVEGSKYGIRFSDGDTVKRIKKFEEEMKMAEKTRFDMCKPTVKKVIFNNPATIVMWSDGTKTVVKCGADDTFDPEKGIAMCCMKKLIGTNATGSNYLDRIKPAFDAAQEEWAKRIVKKEESK